MNETIKCIMTRRSVRAFTDKKISREDLETIVDAARYAPSGMNRQSWRFTVVQDKAIMRRLADAVGGSGYDFYGPDTIIIATNERSSPFGAVDCACALENMFLAAHSLNIGSVWINQLKDSCDSKEVRTILTELSVPAQHIVVGVAALGYAKTPPASANKKDNVVGWYL